MAQTGGGDLPEQVDVQRKTPLQTRAAPYSLERLFNLSPDAAGSLFPKRATRAPPPFRHHICLLPT